MRFHILALITIVAFVATVGSAAACTRETVLAVQQCTSDSPYTIHGLWPQYNSSDWPSYCTNNTFNITKLNNIMDQLDKWWPSCEQNNTSFWSHEWEKHGTCMGICHSQMLDEFDFFNTTLSIFYNHQTSIPDLCNNSPNCTFPVTVPNTGPNKNMQYWETYIFIHATIPAMILLTMLTFF